MKLKIWHNSNFGNEAFTREVSNIKEAMTFLDLLAEYDLYQGDRAVVANAQGLLVLENKEWVEYYNEEGDDINEIRNQLSGI